MKYIKRITENYLMNNENSNAGGNTFNHFEINSWEEWLGIWTKYFQDQIRIHWDISPTLIPNGAERWFNDYLERFGTLHVILSYSKHEAYYWFENMEYAFAKNDSRISFDELGEKTGYDSDGEYWSRRYHDDNSRNSR